METKQKPSKVNDGDYSVPRYRPHEAIWAAGLRRCLRSIPTATRWLRSHLHRSAVDKRCPAVPQYCLINTVRTLDARTRSPGIYTERLRRYSEAVSPDGPCIFPSRKVEDGCCAPPQGSLENPRRGPCRELKTDLYPSARRLKKQNKGKNSTRDGGVSGRPRWEHLPALIAGKTNPCQEFCPTQ